MKLSSFMQPKSSFLSIDKDLSIIINYIMKNDNLKKLLYYTTPDCLNGDDLSPEETIGLFGKNIKIIPKLYADNEILNYIIVSFDNFVENASNPEFRDNIVEFDIVCHYNQWQLNNTQLRPYRIAAEIDSMLNNTRLTGIGQLSFLSADQMILTNEFAGICLRYVAIHGEEDKKDPINPIDEELLVKNFSKMFGQ